VRCACGCTRRPSIANGYRAGTVSVNGQSVAPLLNTATADREAIWTRAEVGPELVVIAEGEVETTDTAGVVRGLRETSRPQVFLRPTPLTEADKRIEDLAAGVTGKSPLDRLHALFNTVADTIEYKPGSTSQLTTAAQALKAGKGVCQDHAHVFISAARQLAGPSRYVVGYLLAEDTKLTETHAWAEAFVPEIGWVGFDAANRLCPTDRVCAPGMRSGCGGCRPDPRHVSGGSRERLSASVDIAQATGQSQSPGSDGQNQTQQ